MKKGRILIRLIMIIFMLAFPIYQLHILINQYRDTRRVDIERRDKLTEEFRDSFLVRREDFYKDRSYQKEFKKLQEKK
ncbi:hypothetical protein PM10SUCC1_14170 [Propionigenium maris DSM 9537]|uniref:Uncharacterized protein n=1 Tax=Propionigenium maris DSM 9537 TaxID=1123000 RepID=A0A9W6GKD0_9FUSO|nr:hypothetical protein [Propionigenium maris]GLI55903.1 hypothetical protein PM10SUCC1_14170 [Propionigenium maris DSM 9537]